MRLDPFIQYGVAASHECIKDSGIKESSLNRDRIGVSIGSGIGGLGTIQKNANLLADQGPKKISPFFVPGSIINMASLASHQGERYVVAYCAAKAAIEGLTRATAVHCKQEKKNIRLHKYLRLFYKR